MSCRSSLSFIASPDLVLQATRCCCQGGLERVAEYPEASCDTGSRIAGCCREPTGGMSACRDEYLVNDVDGRVRGLQVAADDWHAVDLIYAPGFDRVDRQAGECSQGLVLGELSRGHPALDDVILEDLGEVGPVGHERLVVSLAEVLECRVVRREQGNG